MRITTVNLCSQLRIDQQTTPVHHPVDSGSNYRLVELHPRVIDGKRLIAAQPRHAELSAILIFHAQYEDVIDARAAPYLPASCPSQPGQGSGKKPGIS